MMPSAKIARRHIEDLDSSKYQQLWFKMHGLDRPSRWIEARRVMEAAGVEMITSRTVVAPNGKPYYMAVFSVAYEYAVSAREFVIYENANGDITWRNLVAGAGQMKSPIEVAIDGMAYIDEYFAEATDA